MRIFKCFIMATLCAFLITLSFGCSNGTDVKVANPPPDVKPSAPAELKGLSKKAVGPGTSAASGRNPGESN